MHATEAFVRARSEVVRVRIHGRGGQGAQAPAGEAHALVLGRLEPAG